MEDGFGETVNAKKFQMKRSTHSLGTFPAQTWYKNLLAGWLTG
jgi:hypothetical protein